MSWLQGFSDPALAGQLYGGDFPLVDVTVIPDDQIMRHRRVAILELLQKHVRQRDLADLLEQLVTLLLAGYTTQEQLTSLMHYMLQVGEEKGRQESERDAALKIAPVQLSSGLDRESVMKMTGLTADDLAHIHH